MSHQPTLQQLLKVRQMRETQKKYYTIRSPYYLAEAKRLEKEVDKIIDSWQLPEQPRQITLL